MNAELQQQLKQAWQPAPVEPPAVAPDFQSMSALERTAEAFRYALLRWERWVSPAGHLREWLRHNTRLGAWLFIPAVCIMPVIGLVLRQLTGWLFTLTNMAGHLILLLIVFIAIKTVARLLRH